MPATVSAWTGVARAPARIRDAKPAVRVFFIVLSFLKVVIIECFIRTGSTPEFRPAAHSNNEVWVVFATWFSFGATLNKKTGHASMTGLDRKSTRLNSSHVRISYAVFCLKKKKS